MNTSTIDWRAILIVAVILLFVFSPNPATQIVVLAVGAGWAIQSGLSPFRGRGGVLGSTKVTYWRGQKIVTKQPARARLRATSGLQMVVAALYLVLGLGMAYAAVIRFAALVT